jgi:hypothetical protein
MPSSPRACSACLSCISHCLSCQPPPPISACLASIPASTLSVRVPPGLFCLFPRACQPDTESSSLPPCLPVYLLSEMLTCLLECLTCLTVACPAPDPSPVNLLECRLSDSSPVSTRCLHFLNAFLLLHTCLLQSLPVRPLYLLRCLTAS